MSVYRGIRSPRFELTLLLLLAGYPASPGWDGRWEGWGGGGEDVYAKGEVPSIGAYKTGS